jgi:hypothetical protein
MLSLTNPDRFLEGRIHCPIRGSYQNCPRIHTGSLVPCYFQNCSKIQQISLHNRDLSEYETNMNMNIKRMWIWRILIPILKKKKVYECQNEIKLWMTWTSLGRSNTFRSFVLYQIHQSWKGLIKIQFTSNKY